ncbi:MAG: hypothetical protein MI922_27215 [Bacteroidales bacterium]|nr:hypothetical protein [Bacteroidales bacterium]
MNCNRFILIWLICALLPVELFAQTYTDKKVKVFRTSPNIDVEIRNKYGLVHVETWDKDSVQFEIDLSIKANDREKLNKMQESIHFDFTPSKYKIIAQTTFNKARGLITEFVDVFMPSTVVVIDYTVKIPRSASLTIENKYGNIFLDDIYGDVSINLSNGDMTANKLLGNTTIRHNAGDSKIEEIKTGKVYISYGNMHLEKVDKLQLETRSSEIEVEEANLLKIKSKSDEYNITQTNEMFCEGSLTTLNITKLKSEMDGNFRYGEATINNISKSFSFMNLTSEFADIDLYFERNSTYNLDITHHRDVTIQLPNIYSKVETRELNPDEKILLTYGEVGSNVGVNSPKLKITALKKCTVNIIHKK